MGHMGDAIPALVVNLERHAERRAWFLQGAARQGLAVERIAALDAEDPGEQPELRARLCPTSKLSLGEAACLASHRRAWQRIAELGAPFGAVFEDDVHLAADITTLLTPSAIPEGAQFIKLEAFCERVELGARPWKAYGRRELRVLLGRSYGSAAYLVSLRCARRLLELSELFTVPVDHVTFGKAAPLRREFAPLQVVPAPCAQEKTLALLEGRACRFESSLGHVARAPASDAPQAGLRGFAGALARLARGASPWSERRIVPIDLGAGAASMARPPQRANPGVDEPPVATRSPRRSAEPS